METHTCHTANGVPITLGLRVKDYDCEIGTVIGVPDKWDMSDDVCWPRLGHNGHWWKVQRDDGIIKSFDGSRLLAIGENND